VTTIGMNAAYRAWERLGWYPDHYCCLDEELVTSHHEAIRDLVTNGTVASAFLTGRILDFQPELAGHDGCVFLDSYREGPRWRERREKYGVPKLSDAAFETSYPSKLTTGAYAVRRVISLGHREIYLLGIDCNYVELLPDAKEVGGIALEMGATPAENPNYFFDDYQQKGDRYNVPNPEVHGGNLHLQALEAVRDDVHERALPVEIHNCSVRSKLAAEGTFPFEDLDRALGERQLGAVAVPMTFGEEAALIENLKRWATPAAAPRLGGAGYAVPLVLILNGARDSGFEKRVAAAFTDSGVGGPAGAFTGIEFAYCELDAETDRYERDYSKQAGSGGFKSGPNAQFFRSMELLGERLGDGRGRYALMMETDCLAIRPDWLAELERIAEGSEPVWVLGSLYRGVDDVDPRYRLHVNGNAVYAVGDESFQEFLTETWRPALERLVAETPTLAYDCALPLHFTGDAPAPAGERWREWQSIAHRFRFTDFIQNHASRAELERGEGHSLAAIRDGSPRTYLVHGRHLAATLDAEAEPDS